MRLQIHNASKAEDGMILPLIRFAAPLYQRKDTIWTPWDGKGCAQ